MPYTGVTGGVPRYEPPIARLEDEWRFPGAGPPAAAEFVLNDPVVADTGAAFRLVKFHCGASRPGPFLLRRR